MDFHPAFTPYKIKRRTVVYIFVILIVLGSFFLLIQFLRFQSAEIDESLNNSSDVSTSLFVNLPCDLKKLPTKNALYLPIKVLVVADYTMSNYHREHLRNYLYLLFKLSALEYRDESLGYNSLQLEATQFITLDEAATNLLLKGSKLVQSTSHLAVDADTLEQNFCDWQYILKLRTGLKYHAAIYLTKLKLVREVIAEDEGENSTRSETEVLGLANDVEVICDPTKSCAIVQDSNLETSSTIAHEIGHLLGMHNDDSVECQELKLNETIDHTEKGEFIMGIASHVVHVFGSKWSSCSKYSLDNFLKSNDSHCIHITNDRDSKDKVQDHKTTNNKDKNLDFIDPNTLCASFMSHDLLDSNSSIHASKCPGVLHCFPFSCLQGPGLGCLTFWNYRWPDRTSCNDEKNESREFSFESNWCMNGKCTSGPRN